MFTSNPLTTFSLILPLFTSLVFLPSLPLAAAEKSKMTVLPLPTHSTTGNTVLCLANDFQTSIDGFSAPDDLTSAMGRTEKALWSSRHRFLSVERGEEFFHGSNTTNDVSGCKHHLSSLVLSLNIPRGESTKKVPSILDSTVRPVEDRIELEVYHLSVPVNGPAHIEAKTALGLFRGLTTFEQLFYHLPLKTAASGSGQVLSRTDSLPQSEQLPLGSGPGSARETTGEARGPAQSTKETGRTYAPFAPYEVDDKPAFGWRAVLRDTSRNYFSVASLIKMLDTMALVKLNVFHWHITDSNSWPLVLSVFPELAEHGAYSADEIYSEADVRHIVQYAGERGIDVVMEIDTPGHTAMVAPAHPDYVACYAKTPWASYALQPPAGQIRFADPEVEDWTSHLMSAAAGLTSSAYFGTGGDEFNYNCMLEDEPTTRQLDAHSWTLNDAIDHFTGQIHGTLRDGGKTPVVWQEMVLDHGPMPSVAKDTVVEIWVNSADARRVLDKGYRIVHASADYFYLDCGQGGWIIEEGGSNSWCDPFKSWARMYSFDPYKNVDEAQKKLVLGGQTSLWAEQTDETNAETVIWPRAAALAELLWTGAGPNGYPRSSIEALPRMHDIRYRMVDRGVQAVPLQPHWCALRPGVCIKGA